MALAQDKKDHFTAGFLISLVVSYMFNPAWGVIAAFCAGWIKEELDSLFPETHTYDPKDAKYTYLGGIAGAAVIIIYLVSI